MPTALEGLKILDFTILLPGPYATMFLADLGANVLRVSDNSRPDFIEAMPPLVPDMNLSAASAQLGRNKRMMALNLKDPRAVKVIHRLVLEYDIVIENFRPGAMAKLNLDYESLKEINPAVIYCSLTGYGQTGPLRDRPGHDINYIARSGLASYTGKKESGPCLVGMPLAGVGAGANNAVIGILAAVIFRNKTGEGQFIDISMTDGAVAFNAMLGAGFLVDGKDPGYQEHLATGGSLYDYYKTKDQKYISFGGLEQQFFTNFCTVLNRPDLIPGGVAPKDLQKVKKEVSEIISSRTRDEWTTLFNATDACVEPVMTLAEVFDDSLVKEREMIVELELPSGETVRQIANPIKFSASKSQYTSIGVTADTGHTKEVLLDLGYTDEQIEEFEKTGLFS